MVIYLRILVQWFRRYRLSNTVTPFQISPLLFTAVLAFCTCQAVYTDNVRRQKVLRYPWHYILSIRSPFPVTLPLLQPHECCCSARQWIYIYIIFFVTTCCDYCNSGYIVECRLIRRSFWALTYIFWCTPDPAIKYSLSACKHEQHAGYLRNRPKEEMSWSCRWSCCSRLLRLLPISVHR